MRRSRIHGPLAWFLLAGIATAGQIQVPADYPTIQQAMAAAVAGDTITVAPGSYQETVDFLGKDVTLQSSGGPGVTSIVGPPGAGGNSGVLFLSGESSAAVLQGFTIRDCVVAVQIVGSTPTIRDNEFASNWGLDIAAQGAVGLSIQRNVFRNGQTDTLAISLHDSSGDVSFNAISNHPRGGISLTGSSQYNVHHNVIRDSGGYNGWAPAIALFTAAGVWNTIDRNLLLRNHGPAIDAGNSSGVADANITRNRFIENDFGPSESVLSAAGNAGTLIFEGNYCLGPPLTTPYVSSFMRCDVGTLEIRNCVFARLGDTSTLLSSPAVTGQGNPLVIEHCTFDQVEYSVMKAGLPLMQGLNSILWDLVYTWLQWNGVSDFIFTDVGPVPFGGGTNLNADPLFVNDSGGDLHLLAGSPCIDAPSAATPVTTDLDGRPRDATPDLGAYEFVTRSHWFIGSGEAAGTLTLTAQGPVGEAVVEVVSLGLLPQPVFTQFGPLHLLPPLIILPLGQIGPNGTLSLSFTVPQFALPIVLHTQSKIGTVLTSPMEVMLGG